MALTLAGLYTVGGSLLVYQVSVLDDRPVIPESDLPGRIPDEEFVPVSTDATIAL